MSKQRYNGNKSGNFWYLFAGLLLTLLEIPLSPDLEGAGRYSATFLFSLFMLISVWSLSASPRIFNFGVSLVLIINAILGFNAFFGISHIRALLGLLLMLVFCSLSCYIAARNVFVMKRVDLNSLIGAFCVYLLMGLIWALLYQLLYFYGLADFSGPINKQALFPDLLYFSFVTLASLGYGDISPVGGLLRTLAYLEAVIGQFYLAVMVASLVGVYSSGRKQES